MTNILPSASFLPGALPPFTPILSALIADPRLPNNIFRSYMRLYAAAWTFAYQRTPDLDFSTQLLPLLGISRSQARQHLQMLRTAGLINWSSDGSQRYVIHFSGAPDSVGVDVNSNHKFLKINIHQQQHTLSQKPEASTATPETAPDDPNYERALHYLQRAGVWSVSAQNAARKIAANIARPEKHLPGLGDVLGWIAYCFADREKNRITNPPAALAANLNAGRCCPENYLPPLICANCHYSEGYCECEGEPEYGYPPEFLERALRVRSGYELPYADRWGVCIYCCASPCQCEEAEDGE